MNLPKNKLTSAGADFTIAALATPIGRGGVGIIRVSGLQAREIAQKILGFDPKPRYAHYAPFYDRAAQLIDQGIALFFPGPHSYTGEDVLELQGHGGPVIMDLLLAEVLQLGAKLAEPGEFTRRAFLNNKLDLTQAEAVADLINANSVQAARAAVRSLHGDFAQCLGDLTQETIKLRVYIEAALDFPDEEIDFLAQGQIIARIEKLAQKVQTILAQTKSGKILQEGLSLVLAGLPNAGKSSLLNALAQEEVAIVTEIPGTTRDILSTNLTLGGLPLRLVDTAGLRHSEDLVENKGIARALQQIEAADLVLVVLDGLRHAQELAQSELAIRNLLPAEIRDLDLPNLLVVVNKIDEAQIAPHTSQRQGYNLVHVSAKTRAGLDLLITELKKSLGLKNSLEGNFSARQRHLQALFEIEQALAAALNWGSQRVLELMAEELRVVQQSLGKITGEFNNEDLLDEIFLNFCIGK